MYNGIEDFMLSIGWWQNYQSQSKIFDPPNEYIISSVKEHWSPSLPAITLVPEVFADFSPLEMRELRSDDHELRSSEKEKHLVTLDLNLTFMHTERSASDPQALIGGYFCKHANQYDWFV